MPLLDEDLARCTLHKKVPIIQSHFDQHMYLLQRQCQNIKTDKENDTLHIEPIALSKSGRNKRASFSSFSIKSACQKMLCIPMARL